MAGREIAKGADGARPATSPTLAEVRYGQLLSLDAVREALEGYRGAGQVALETLVAGRDAVGAGLAGLSLCFEPGVAFYIPVGHESGMDAQTLLRQLTPIVGPGGPANVAHDSKLAVMVMRQYGVELEPLGFDTALAAFLLNESATELEELAAARLGMKFTSYGRLLGAGEPEELTRSMCERADAILRLCAEFQPELEARGQMGYLREMELPLVPVLADMELAGIRVDTAVLAELSRELSERLRALEADMEQLAGYRLNPRSPQQLGKLLYEDLGLEGTRKTTTGYSMDVHALEALAGQHPIIERILEHRQLARLKDTYVDTLPQLVNPQTGRLHTHLSQTTATSGRLVSSDPNLQNIPIRTPLGRQVRRAFVAEAPRSDPSPDPRVFLSADYSQIELRVLAHVTGEPRLLDAFARDEDVHTLTAAQLYGVTLDRVTPDMRRTGKAVNYGVIYGMTGYRLARDTGLDRKKATEFVRRHAELFPAIQAYFEETLQSAEEKGYVETPLGRRRYLPDLRSPSRQKREAARRAAENMPNQGTTADIIKQAMLKVHARLRERSLRARMLLQVHDELLLELPESELSEVAELVLAEMSGAAKLSVPLKVEAKCGPNWGEMHRLSLDASNGTSG